MQAVEKLYTIEDMARLRLAEDHELDRGVLVLVSQGTRTHGRLIMRLCTKIGPFVEEQGLGESYTADTGFVLQRNPDTLRGPDVAFLRTDRVPGPGVDTWLEGAPDLAIEVLSGGDRPGQVKKKVRQYLEAGSRLVWVFDPRRKRVHVYRPDGTVQVLRVGDTLDGGDVLAGFRWPVSDIFR